MLKFFKKANETIDDIKVSADTIEETAQTIKETADVIQVSELIKIGLGCIGAMLLGVIAVNSCKK